MQAMKMEVQIISKENVKPSSSTPTHLRTFKFSLLDQLIPSSYAPLVLFYPMNKNISNLDVPSRLNLLKASLSQTLTWFYPLAGKIKDELSIDCNDEGAYFVETRVSCGLHEFLNHPDLLLIQKLLPREFVVKELAPGSYVTNIQANVFSCGGVAIGICISHKILDGAALGTFLKGWTSAAMGCNEPIYPNFIAASLFPANDLWLRDSSSTVWGSLLRQGNCITRRFVFDSSAIAKLKAQATSSGVKCPTRAEVVSAFLWKSTLAASAELHGFQRPSLLTHLVNLRKRMEPSLSENSLGNLLWMAAARYTAGSKPELNNLVSEVREAISRIDAEFVKQIKGEEGNSVMSQSLKAISEMGSGDGVDYFGFSSWCNFGYYGTDFGWGKPVWVSSIGLTGSVFMNLIILADTRLGDGIEAWVTLDEQDMGVLEGNPDLLKLALLDPSPLLIDDSVQHCHM
ncbi:hypothetical protein P3X46_001934 [Hevea brasiliensis]|uniref:Uncharacterized protein n=1 Tax=Hevea brasiliensis TaxID=3981 RepID=A0ABQ9N6A6_HEVBR|nr:stemmadenine O-acetyltransferase [Hevea brasiliensis]KAJ9186354.1 hypothetical protein P3X46_001934 [Hevea brasiliensis]